MKVPITEKKDYQQDLSKLLSKGFNKNNVFIANTSGSSGHPFFYAKNKFSHAITWALIKQRYDLYSLNLNSKQARFYGQPLENSSYYKESIKDLIMNRVRFPIFDMSDSILTKFLKKFKKHSFQFIYGYTNSLVLFARFLIIKKIILKDVCPSIKLCITTSETCTKEDKYLLYKGFGVKIVNEYGISEAGGITAFEDFEGNWTLSSETQFIEFVDDNGQEVIEGEQGNILITDLYNRAMPFIRYKVGDIAQFRVDKDGNRYLNNLLGRTNDNIILPNGKVSPGLTFYYISRSILESSGVLREFIIRQTAIDTFVFDIVSNRSLTKDEIGLIKSKMDIYLQPDLKLVINHLKNIIRPNSGKLKHFYSEIEN
mgnify:CR=1 FL=1